ncbi:MAG: bifunctional adenosylcobinamide kinase/adenosylcobinamide-phosphate guanylyltransferase [Rhodobacteraceae bacterium]|nr:MAG: bifunctional adenosylcobinamide kinase/adenosylcobinamide-phosphate guanylyltransferase [Paracoccaceae bacterium]
MRPKSDHPLTQETVCSLAPRFGRALVLGGARSGKSRAAEDLARAAGGPRVYVATAQAWDAEMADRIARHRADRGAGWETVEAPRALIPALRAADCAGAVILVDCLTLWLTNVMLAEEDVEAAGAGLVAALPTLAARLIFVSNEVGMGIVPDTPLGRRFRDAQGRLNQRMAAACDTVLFVAAGLPLTLKRP